MVIYSKHYWHMSRYFLPIQCASNQNVSCSIELNCRTGPARVLVVPAPSFYDPIDCWDFGINRILMGRFIGGFDNLLDYLFLQIPWVLGF